MINLISYYRNATNLFICPTTTTPNPVTTGNTIAGDVLTPWASQLPRAARTVDGVTYNPAYYFGGYGYNGWCFSDKLGDGSGTPANYFVKESAIKRAAITPVFYDQTWTDCWPTEAGHPDQDLYGVPGTTLPTGGVGANSFNRLTKARHGSGGGVKAPKSFSGNAATLPGAINMGFADGHSETVKLMHLWDYSWHAQWRPTSVPDPTTLTAN